MASNDGYPALFVGQRWTATLAQSTMAIQAWKASSLGRASLATRTADPDLVLPVEANALYKLEFFLAFTCTSATPGTNFAWTAPSGTTGSYAYSASGDIHSTFTALTSGGGPASINGTVSALGRGQVDVGSTAGSLTLVWSQLVSNAATLTLEAGSWIELRRME